MHSSVAGRYFSAIPQSKIADFPHRKSKWYMQVKLSRKVPDYSNIVLVS